MILLKNEIKPKQILTHRRLILAIEFEVYREFEQATAETLRSHDPTSIVLDSKTEKNSLLKQQTIKK